MGKRVYDPIHDTYQVQGTPEPLVLSTTDNKTNEGESDSESTESESTPASNYTNPQDGKAKHNSINDTEQLAANRNKASDSVAGMGSITNEATGSKGTPGGVVKTRTKHKEPSRYTRHLKKSDGEPFTRNDIHFQFLSDLLSDKRQLFSNPYKEFFSLDFHPIETRVINVTDDDYDAKSFIGNEKLTFSQIYILTIASSTKCSKVLRDKLLFDHYVAFSTCVLSLLVNMGRLNTTVNFFLEMTSQLRTFHSIPCLQHYSTDPKPLQDTPRIKSILKTIPLGSDIPIEFHKWYSKEEVHSPEDWVNPISLLFAFCDQHAILDWNILIPNCEEKMSLFQLFDTNSYQPKQRVDLFLWLMYIHTETDLSSHAIQSCKHLFGIKDNAKFPLQKADTNFDEDTEVEVEYGEEQLSKRIEFLRQTGAERTIVQQTMEVPSETNDGTSSVAKNKHSSQQNLASEEFESSQSQPVIIQQDTQRKKRQSSPITTNSEVKSSFKTKVQRSKDERIQAKIDLDNEFRVTPDFTQKELRDKLIESQKISMQKRHELGLMKMFDEFEDVPLATIIGIRGKKRKKYSDGILGYETDMLGVLRHSKRLLLHKLREERNIK